MKRKEKEKAPIENLLFSTNRNFFHSYLDTSILNWMSKIFIR